MRVLVLYVVVTGLLFYSFRDWFKCLCALIAMTAVAEHPDMPRSLFHIPGLNVWNALFLAVLAGWALARGRERLSFNPPLSFALVGAAYALVVVVASLRLLANPVNLPFSTGELAMFCLGSIKFVIPGLLLFDGCRNRSRLNFAVLGILAYYLLIAVQIVKWVPPWYALDAAELERRSREILRKEMGFYRTDLSTMMAGAAWAFLSARVLFEHRALRLALLGAGGLATLAVALTAGRAGYITWAVVGAVFAFLRFRKALVLLPLSVLLATWLLPGVTGRMREGFSSSGGGLEEPVDKNAVSAGRTEAWPHVIEAIGEAPWFGYGRQAMVTTGLYLRSSEVEGEIVPHPHNLFLELLLDAGWVGFVPVIAFYVLLVVAGIRLMMDTRSSLFLAGGGVPMALILAFLVSGIGGRHFYPDENSFAMWCAVGLLIRTWVERSRILRAPQIGAGAGRIPKPGRAPAASWPSRSPSPLRARES